MDRLGEHHDEMWDEQDGFFYDLLRLPDGQAHAFEGAVAGGAAAAVRVDGVRGGFRHSLSEADGDDRPVSPTPPRVGFPCRPDRRRFHRL